VIHSRTFVNPAKYSIDLCLEDEMAKKAVIKATKRQPAKKPVKKAKAPAPAKAKRSAPAKKKPESVKRVAPAKKVPAKKAPAKTPAKAAAVKKQRTTKAPGKSSSPKGRPQPVQRVTRAPSRDRKPPAGKARKKFSAKELTAFRKLLLNLRDQVVDEIRFLAGENLSNSRREASGDLSNYGMHMADQGTDNFDREFALSLVSSEQDVIYEIDEALHRIDAGTYGICEISGEPIEIERLKALPYARNSRAAQEQLEKTRRPYRSFHPSLNT
jgi:RNA polymerase-binding transcription factor DksA